MLRKEDIDDLRLGGVPAWLIELEALRIVYLCYALSQSLIQCGILARPDISWMVSDDI